jgi:hypothetical protein
MYFFFLIFTDINQCVDCHKFNCADDYNRGWVFSVILFCTDNNNITSLSIIFNVSGGHCRCDHMVVGFITTYAIISVY